MNADVKRIEAIVFREMARISDKRIFERLTSLLVPIRQELRIWNDDADEPIAFSCWIFAEEPLQSVGVAYSEAGYGPSRPWGTVATRGKYRNEMGKPWCWGDSLELSFRASSAWNP
jgi:hypothetical protein